MSEYTVSYELLLGGLAAMVSIAGVVYYNRRSIVKRAQDYLIDRRMNQLIEEEETDADSDSVSRDGALITYKHQSKNSYALIAPSPEDAAAIDIDDLVSTHASIAPHGIVAVKLKTDDADINFTEDVIAFLGPKRNFHSGLSKEPLTFRDIIHASHPVDVSDGKIVLMGFDDSYMLDTEYLDPSSDVFESRVLQRAIEH